MPPLPPPGKVIRVEFKVGTNASVEAGSRFFVTYTGGPCSAGDLNTFASDVATNWGVEIAPFVFTTEALHGVTCTDLATDVGAEGTWTGDIAGTDANGAELPANAAAVVNHHIARRYRGGRPRTYLRAGTTASLATGSTNEWSTTFQNSLLTAWSAWVTYVGGRSYASFTVDGEANVSWFSGNTVFTTPTGRARNIPVKRAVPLLDPIVGSVVAAKVGSQRKRLDI